MDEERRRTGMNEKMIEVKNIVKSFDELQVLKEIDLTIYKGEVVSIVGPSGAGKTTLLQIMGTLDRADSGTVVINGMEISKLKEKELSAFRNRQIGFVFQFHQLLPEFTALENVMMPALIGGTPFGKAVKKAEEALELMGLAERASHKPAELSGGEKQSLMIARAIYKDSPFVLLDEPAAALDPIAENNLYKTCDTIFKDKCVFFVSHRMSSVSFCDKIMLISGNVIKEIGTHNELMTRNGIYAQMYKTQRQYYRSEDGKK